MARMSVPDPLRNIAYMAVPSFVKGAKAVRSELEFLHHSAGVLFPQ